MLLDLISDVSSWPELEARIAALSEEHERGVAFEEFCIAYFALSDLFQFKAVYRHNEIPPSLCSKLGYPENRDIGIDGLGVTQDDKLYVWQAKFRQDRSKTPTKRELSTFFTFSDKADWRITITNANNIPHELNDRNRQSKILSDRLDALNVEFFDNLRAYLSSNIKKRKEPESPHSTQLEAIEAAVEHFSNETRGQLILPCGTGKTLASLWIAERLGNNRILVMVPSLSLMDQTLREWASNTSLRPFRYQCLCSDTSVDLGNDAPIEHIYDMEVPVTTDAASVAEFLTNQPDVPSVLLSTYQSGKVLVEAVKQAGAVFDVAIFDEAHRTTGSDTGLWGLALHDSNVPIKKRLFMTATPRIYAPHITKKAQENDVLLCSMDDHSIYGKPFYTMNFGEAIERGHITDYKIIVVYVTDSEVRQLINQDGRIATDGLEWDAKAFAKRVALVKAIREYGLRKIFTFHGKVKGAEAFTNIKSPYGIAQVSQMFDQTKEQTVPECFHVHGGMSSGVRKRYMVEFSKADIGIMSNARCLTEGIDVPAVDAVAFIDPKRSLIDIIQATGRALRIPPRGCGYEKERGYIFIPVFVEGESTAEKFIENSDFDSVWKVLQAMKDQDQRLEDMIRKLRILQGKGEEGRTPDWKRAMTEYGEKLIFFNLPKNVDTEKFIKTIYTRTLEVVGVNWDHMYGQLVAYKDQYGDCNVSDRWSENPQLGTWVGKQRTKRNSGLLSKERVERLIQIGFIWDAVAANWEEMYVALCGFTNDHGHCNVPNRWPENVKLSRWVSTQREFYKCAKLSEDRIRRLKIIDFEWDMLESNWASMFSELQKFKERFGHCNVSRDWLENRGLSLWVSKQRATYRKGLLNRDRIESLEQLGFIWDTIETSWETNYSFLLEYKNAYGDCNVPDKWPDNMKLSHWVAHQRSDWKRKLLSEDRYRSLEALGFTWDPYDAIWDSMYSTLLEFKKNKGHCNVPRTPENNKLRRWVERLRKLLICGKLKQERVIQLEKVGFVVIDQNKIQSDKWEQMHSMLREFKNAHGHCKVPNGWPQNPQLAFWVSNQRQMKRKGCLSTNYLRELEEIGFVWHTRENLWEHNFTELIEYKKDYGHCIVPHDWPENPKLGLWVINQRRNKKTVRLSADRMQRLDEIGFTWDIIDSAWECNFLKLHQFYKTNDHTNVPAKWVADPQLGKWVSHQRVKHKRGQLSEAQTQSLDEIKFNWNPKNTWNEMFSHLVEYRSQYEHCNVPRDWQRNPELSFWVNRQRRLHNLGKLDLESTNSLESIGFLWDVREDVWEKRYSELVSFKKCFGHCSVLDKWQENQKLGNWVGVQRRAYLKGNINNERIERLNEVGFVWTPADDSWEEMYSELVRFKDFSGHCHVPKSFVDNPGLGRWAARQRASVRNGQMNGERLQRLIEVGFNVLALQAPACRDAELELVAPLHYSAEVA